MLPGAQFGERRGHVVVGRRQRELVAVDLVEPIFALDEDGLGRLRAEGGFADAFGAMHENAWRLGRPTVIDAASNVMLRTSSG